MKINEYFNKFLLEMTEQYPDIHIQIMATCNEAGITKSIYTGLGNWYARQGLAHEFINNDIAQENATQLANKLKQQDEN